MKTRLLAALIAAACFLSCRKDGQAPTPPGSIALRTSDPAIDTLKADSMPAVPFPHVSSCSLLPIYGDTVIYPQPTTGGDYILKPVNDPGAGTYFGWPGGLAISATTGAIDITQSETGMRFAVGFVRAGSTDTCIQYVTLGGASYIDSVYVVTSGGVKASPYFDGNPSAIGNCGSGNGNGSGCKFDVTGSAGALRVKVNNSSGEIDLKNTLDGNNSEGGVFGLSPFNGQTVMVPMYYQVKKGSNNAMQLISLQFVYYDSQASLNAALLLTVDTRSSNLYGGALLGVARAPRPPLVIVTR
jgi:hypothetical protein